MKANLKFEAVPWSPSTKGTVSGEVVSIVPPETPTEEELTAFLVDARAEGEGRHRHGRRAAGGAGELQRTAQAHARRSGACALLAADPNAAQAGRGGRGGGPGGGRGGRGGRRRLRPKVISRRQQVNQRITAFLRDNPPALRLVRAGRRPDSRRHRRAERRRTDLRRRHAAVARQSFSATTTTAASSASSPTARR